MHINYARVAIFAASALVAFLISSVSQASCGDYVYSRFQTPTHRSSMVIQRVEVNTLDVAKSEIRRETAQNLPVEVAESVSQPAAPCHGPNCSQNPTPLVPVAPSSTVGSSSQDWLIFGHRSAEIPSQVSLRRDLKSNARSRRGYPLQIDMPPELAG